MSLYSSKYNYYDRYDRSSSLRLSDSYQYIASPDLFSYFVKNVQLQSEGRISFMRDTGISSLIKNIKKTSFGTKIILPMRTLCLRFYDESKSINELHVYFLQYVCKLSCYKEALPVIDKKVPLNIQSQKVFTDYFYHAMVINFQLSRYKQATQNFTQLMAILQGGQASSQTKISGQQLMTVILFLELASMLDKYKQKIDTLIQQETTKFYYDKKIFLILQHYLVEKKLDPQQQSVILTQDISKKLFIQAKNSNAPLRDYIQAQISDNYERIRIGEIKGCKLDKLETMQKINMLEELAKYDCKQGILYLNHQKYQQKQINCILSKCYQMYQGLKHFQEKKNKQKQKQSFRFW